MKIEFGGGAAYPAIKKHLQMRFGDGGFSPTLGQHLKSEAVKEQQVNNFFEDCKKAANPTTTLTNSLSHRSNMQFGSGGGIQYGGGAHNKLIKLC